MVSEACIEAATASMDRRTKHPPGTIDIFYSDLVWQMQLIII